MAADANSLNAEDGATRRDFLYVAAAGFGAVAVGAAAWPLIDQMNPSADVLALSSIEVDLSPVKLGEIITVMWRKQPVFIRHRTPEEIARAEKDDNADLIDPQRDEDRVKKPEWLVVMASCTHLGCVPIGPSGEYNGWLCPCHGSEYDASGRVRRGPAPKNLEVPEYSFIGDTKIKLG